VSDSSDLGSEVVFWHGALFGVHSLGNGASKFGWDSWGSWSSWGGWSWSSFFLFSILSIIPVVTHSFVLGSDGISSSFSISSLFVELGLGRLEVNLINSGSLVNFLKFLVCEVGLGLCLDIGLGLCSSSGSSSLISLLLCLSNTSLLSSLDKGSISCLIGCKSSSGLFPLGLVDFSDISFSLFLSLGPMCLLGGIGLGPFISSSLISGDLIDQSLLNSISGISSNSSLGGSLSISLGSSCSSSGSIGFSLGLGSLGSVLSSIGSDLSSGLRSTNLSLESIRPYLSGSLNLTLLSIFDLWILTKAWDWVVNWMGLGSFLLWHKVPLVIQFFLSSSNFFLSHLDVSIFTKVWNLVVNWGWLWSVLWINVNPLMSSDFFS